MWIKSLDGLPELNRKIFFVHNKKFFSNSATPDYEVYFGEVKFLGMFPFFVTDCKQFQYNEVPLYQYAEIPALPE